MSDETQIGESYTVTELAKITGVPFYTVHYLAKLNKLPVIEKGGRGVPARYSPDSVMVINQHKNKGK